MLALAQFARDARSLNGLPAAARHALHQLDFIDSQHAGVAECTAMAATNRPCFRIGTQITARIAVICVRRPLGLGDSRILVAVLDDVWFAGSHQPQALFAELSKRVAADDAVDAVVVVAGEQERVFVVLDGRVGAAVDREVFAQAPAPP